MVDKKKLQKQITDGELKGFEEFIEEMSAVSSPIKGKHTSGETLNFIQADQQRLSKLKDLLSVKIDLLTDYPSSEKLIANQKKSNLALKEEIITTLIQTSSSANKSFARIFDLYFKNENS